MNQAREKLPLLLDHLKRKRPPLSKRDFEAIVTAVEHSRQRHDRYAVCRDAWLQYKPRQDRLDKIGRLAVELKAALVGLDLLSRDDLEERMGSEKLVAALGDLEILAAKSDELASAYRSTQKTGRPLDLAEWRWIYEMADIYECYFAPKKASIHGGGSSNRGGPFYRFVSVSFPDELPRNGKLGAAQVDNILKKRKKDKTARVKAS